MFTPSGILLPREGLLETEEIRPGLFVVKHVYERDLGYFAPSPIVQPLNNGDAEDEEGGRGSAEKPNATESEQ